MCRFGKRDRQKRKTNVLYAVNTTKYVINVESDLLMSSLQFLMMRVFRVARFYSSVPLYEQKWKEGNTKESFEMLHGMVEKDPQNVVLKKELLDMMLALNYLKEGSVLASDILEQEQCAATLFKMGECHERMGELEKAVDCYEASLNLERSWQVLRRVANLMDPTENESIVFLSEAIDLCEDDKDAKALLLVDRGLIKLRNSDLDGAMSDFDAAIKQDEQCAIAYFALGDCYLMRAEPNTEYFESLEDGPEKAAILQDLKKAIGNYDLFWDWHLEYFKKYPEFEKHSGDFVIFDYCVKRAACYTGLEDWPMVEQAADYVLILEEDFVDNNDIKPKLALAHYYRARAYESHKEYFFAVRHYQSSIKLSKECGKSNELAEKRKNDIFEMHGNLDPSIEVHYEGDSRQKMVSEMLSKKHEKN